MKRRIIGMLLVAVMLIGSLVSCGYSYEKDDLSKYATFDKDAFEKAISALVIEDGDFTKDADTRADKVIDTIRKALAKKADTDDKKTEGVIGEYDTFYYCYYGTITVDGEEKVIFASSMKQSSATNFQFGLKGTEGLQAKIEAAFKDYDLTEKAYSTTTSGKAESGKIAYISYTVEYDKDGKSVTENYENVRVTLGEGSDVAKKLAGITILDVLNRTYTIK